jgi:hypothetical protein
MGISRQESGAAVNYTVWAVAGEVVRIRWGFHRMADTGAERRRNGLFVQVASQFERIGSGGPKELSVDL